MQPRALFEDSTVATVLLALAVPVTVLGSACGVGLPLFSIVTLAMLRSQLKAANVVTYHTSMLAGFLMAGLLVGLAIAAGLGISVGEHLLGYDSYAYWGASVGPALLLLLLSPLTLLPCALVDRRSHGVAHALRAALDGWSQLPASRRLLLWFLPTSATISMPILASLNARPPTFLWGVGVPIAAISGVTSLYLVSSWVAVRDVLVDVDESARVPRGTLVLGGVTTALTLGVGVVVTVALLTPVPMSRHRYQTPRTLEHIDPSVWHSTPQRIAGTSLEVRLDGDGVMIEADDGGGVGRVEPTYGVAESFRVRDLRDGGHRVVLKDGSSRWFVDIDDEGVRMDDGLGRRFDHHVGLFGLLILMALVLGWLFCVLAAIKLARAVTLRAIKSSTDKVSADTRRVLEGTVRFGEGASVAVDDDQLRASGSVWIEGAGLRVRIPDSPVRVRGSGTLRDGDRVALVGTFDKLTSDSHREASATWPHQAFLVVGGRDLAVKVAIRLASNVAVAALSTTLVVSVGFLFYVGLKAL